MPGKVVLCLVIVSVFSAIFFTGCAAPADLAMKFTPDDAGTYKVTTEMIKDYRFEQPTAGKLVEQQSVTKIETEFLRKVESVDKQGNALVTITLNAIKFTVVDKDDTKLDVDSKRKSDKSKPLAKLVGQSYKIKITPAGGVKVVNAKKIRSMVKSGHDGQVAKNFLSNDSIVKRHEVPALPDSGQNLAAGSTWSRIKASPQGLLTPKSYEKIYTLSKIENRGGKKVAVVEMNAIDSAIPAADASMDGGMGPLAKVFDTEENFSGQLIFDLAGGTVRKYNEKLVATYVAAESPPNQKPGKGPDTLTMGFIYAISKERVE